MSLLDESAKIVTSRLGPDRLRVAGTAEFNGYNRDIRADRIQPLVNWVNRNFDISTEHVVPWAGLRPMMPNMLPVVKQSKQSRVFYNTGHGHLGWTLSAATAVLVSQDIQQKVSRIKKSQCLCTGFFILYSLVVQTINSCEALTTFCWVFTMSSAF